jgi:hypothetical protein
LKNPSEVYNEKLSELHRVLKELAALRIVAPLLAEGEEEVKEVSLGELKQQIREDIEALKDRVDDPRRS